MINRIFCCNFGLAALAVCSALTVHSNATTIKLGSGDVLTAVDLTNGSFNGQAFTVDDTLTININDGGEIESLGESASTYFDFNGATINVNNGGDLDSTIFDRTWLQNVKLNVFSGGTLGSGFRILDSDIVVYGGQVGSFGNFNGQVDFTMFDGLLGQRTDLSSESQLTFHGGQVDNALNTAVGSRIDIFGGIFGSVFVSNDMEFNIYATQASLDGIDLGLEVGESLVIDSNAYDELIAELTDEASFDLQFDAGIAINLDRFGNIADVTVIGSEFIPEPSSGLIAVAGMSLLTFRRRSRDLN